MPRFPKQQHRTHLFMAPSKAFNMPGLGSSYAITVDKDIRERFQTFMEAGEFAEGHLLAYIQVRQLLTCMVQNGWSKCLII